MQTDEAGMHARLKVRYQDLVVPMIDRYGGRVVKLMGAGMPAEFSSFEDAVRAAVKTQQAVAEKPLCWETSANHPPARVRAA